MSETPMNHNLTVIISQDRGDRPSRLKLQQDLADALAKRPGVEVLVVGPLYDLPPDGPGVQALQAISADVILLGWLYARAALWTLDAVLVSGSPDAADSGDREDTSRRIVRCFDLHDFRQAGPLLKKIDEILARSDGGSASPGETAQVAEQTRFRWYPVIDFDRCTNCLECLNFCLFGVFGMDASDRILVEQPDACRHGCPACARVCPPEAIMFPLHTDPVLAGVAGPGEVPSSGGASRAELAAAERDKALAARARTEQPAVKDELDALDKLVDELDRADL